MGRAGDSSLLLLVVYLGLVSSTSATFDYQNFLDETIAMYILMGIAVVYFTFTVFLVILTLYCGCCRKKRGRTGREREKHPKVDPGTFNLEDRKPQPKKQPLSPIQETSFDTQPPSRRHSRHRRSQRDLREDQIPLNEGGPADQPPSPTDSNATDMPPPDYKTSINGGDMSSQAHEQTHEARLAPIQRTPDHRKKRKMVKQPDMPPAPASGNSSDLPPHDYPKEIHPGQTSAKAPTKRTPDLRKEQKIQPSTDHLSSEGDRQHSGLPSQPTENGIPRTTEKQAYASEHAWPPVRRTLDMRKNSPRMLRKAKVLPSSTAPPLATSARTPESFPKIPRELGPKGTQFPASMTPKESHKVEEEGGKGRVSPTAEKHEVSPYDSEHMLPPVTRSPDIRKNSPRMLRKTKVQPSSAAPALATSSHTPELSSKAPRELGPKDTQFPETGFSMTSKESHKVEGEGGKETVSPTAEKHEVSPYDSEHVLPPVKRTPDIHKDSPRMLHKTKVQPSSAAPALATSSHTPELSSKAPCELGPKDTQFPEAEFVTSKKDHLDTNVGIMNPGFEEAERVSVLAFQNELKPVARHWYKIGKQLQISESTLRTIRTVHWKSYEKCLGEVGINWLKEETSPTWNKVVKALRSENLVFLTGKVADDLQQKYCPEPASMSSATSGKSYTML